MLNVGSWARLATGTITALAVAHGIVGWALQPDSPASWTIGEKAGFAVEANGICVGICVGALAGALAGSGVLGASEDTAVQLGMPPSVQHFAWLQFALGFAMLLNGLDCRLRWAVYNYDSRL